MKIKKIIREYYTPMKDGIISGFISNKIIQNIDDIYVRLAIGVIIVVVIVSLLYYLNKIVSDK